MSDFGSANNTVETALELGTLGFPGNTFEGRTTARIFDFDSVGRTWSEPFTTDTLDHFTFDPYKLITVSVNFNADTVGNFANELVFFPMSGVSKVSGAIVGTWNGGEHARTADGLTQARAFLGSEATSTLNFLKLGGLGLGIDFDDATWEQNRIGGADAVWTLTGEPVVIRAFGLQGNGTQAQIDDGGSIPVEVDYSFSFLPRTGEIDDPEPISKFFVNDYLEAETIIGGDAIDTFDAGGDREDFSFSFLSDDRIVVTDSVFPEFPDTLTNVERVEFFDGFVAFDTEGNAGQAYRLYQAAFDRTPDAEGLGFWIDNYDDGNVDLVAMAGYFMQSEEFASKYGDPISQSDQSFLTLLYNNVLDRNPDQLGFDFWSDQQDVGLSRPEMLQYFSESVENHQNVAGAIADGIWYI